VGGKTAHSEGKQEITICTTYSRHPYRFVFPYPPASPAHAGGVVSICDEAHLKAALAGGGAVTFTCSGTIHLTSTIIIDIHTWIDGSGQAVTISGDIKCKSSL